MIARPASSSLLHSRTALRKPQVSPWSTPSIPPRQQCPMPQPHLPPQRSRPLRHPRRRPLSRRWLRKRGRHVVALCCGHLLRTAAHPERAGRHRPGGGDRRRSRAASSSRWPTRWRPARWRSASTSSTGPTREVIDRFEANCAKHGVPAERRITWKADSRTMQPGRAAGQARRPATALHPHRRRAFARGAEQGPGACHRRARLRPASSCSTTCCTRATRP